MRTIPFATAARNWFLFYHLSLKMKRWYQGIREGSRNAEADASDTALSTDATRDSNSYIAHRAISTFFTCEWLFRPSDCFASSSRLAHYEILAFPRDKISSLVKRLYLFTHTDSRQIAIYSPINRELLFSHLTIMQNIIINIIPNCIGFVHK